MEGVGGKDTILGLLLPDLDLFNAATEKRRVSRSTVNEVMPFGAWIAVPDAPRQSGRLQVSPSPAAIECGEPEAISYGDGDGEAAGLAEA